MKIVRLKFTTPIHISNNRTDYGISETFLHSDTLYSAILSAWSYLGFQEYLVSLQNIPFVCSSLFPYISYENKYYYFLPRPLSFQPSVNIDLLKKVKKIEFIQAEIFKKIQKGEEITITEDNLKGNFLTEITDNIKIYEKSVQNRVRIPRGFGFSQPFYVDRLYFSDNAGLYFFLKCESPEVEKAISSALDYLRLEGFGTDRNVGNGKFEFEIDENAQIIHFEGLDTTYSMNLSLFIPEKHKDFVEIIDENSKFTVLIRGGWITSYHYLTFRKKYIRTIGEGSTLRIPNGISGRIVDVTPDISLLPTYAQNIHRIYRVGKAIWVPIKFSI